MPEFSIVTSFYNEDSLYIERLYNQILRTGVDWEWIVTDDYSENREVNEKLSEISSKDSRVRKIVQYEKREIFRNPSLYTRGEFIFHIDGDDLFHPLYLKHTKKWFRKFSDVVCIISGSCWVKENGALIRYGIDDPFCLPHEKNGIRYPSHNYIGRIWRSSCEIDFSEVFSNPKNIIRQNDRYIVEFLSTKGDVLHLPRPYVFYTQRENSNTYRERKQEEELTIENTYIEFDNWLEKNRDWFSKNPYFYTGDVSFSEYILPFHHIMWSVEKRKCGVFGFSNLPVLRKLLIELYPELDINFEPPENILQDMSFFVVYNLDIEKNLPKNKNVYFATSKKEEIDNFYENELNTRNTSWVFSDETLWVCLYR